MTFLAVDNLSKSFGGVRAVHNLSFEIEAGLICALIGPNGAGKTTVFNLITGVYRPTSGTIVFENEETNGSAPPQLAARGMSRTFQNLQVFFNMTVLENVMVGRHLHCDHRFVDALLRLPRIRRADAACRDAALELLRFVGLGSYAESEAASLPLGALKRLEVARALAAEPKLLLLDEPAAGLNPSETRELDRLIQEIAGNGTTILLVEHDMRLVMRVSDRIIVLNQGRMLADGTAAQVRNHPEVIKAYLGTQVGAL